MKKLTHQSTTQDEARPHFQGFFTPSLEGLLTVIALCQPGCSYWPGFLEPQGRSASHTRARPRRQGLLTPNLMVC